MGRVKTVLRNVGMVLRIVRNSTFLQSHSALMEESLTPRNQIISMCAGPRSYKLLVHDRAGSPRLWGAALTVHRSHAARGVSPDILSFARSDDEEPEI